MIKTENLVPQVYYKDSRDFQFIGRLYDIIFHYMKNTSEIVGKLRAGLDDKDFIDLPLLTVGLQIKHNYDYKQAQNLVSCFQTILRNKGSLKGIKLLVSAILNAEGIPLLENSVIVVKDTDDKQLINIYVSQKVKDITLIYDILDYIIPVGMSFRIIRASAAQTKTENTLVDNSAEVTYEKYDISTKSYLPTVAESTGNSIPKPADKGVGRIDNAAVSNGTNTTQEVTK